MYLVVVLLLLGGFVAFTYFGYAQGYIQMSPQMAKFFSAKVDTASPIPEGGESPEKASHH